MKCPEGGAATYSGDGIRVSVILPVFNVEPYIERCIESLQAQTMNELEFVFVDDCSTDGSMDVVEKWAAQDRRVHVLRNEANLGAGPSRNRGIEVARGEYLSFIDPDDYVAFDFYELLYSAATSGGGHDIAKGRCCKVDGVSGEVGEPEEKQNDRISKRLGGNEPLYRLFTYEHWTGLWRKSLFDNAEVRYGSSVNAQDSTFQLRACYQTNDIILEDNALYYYVQRADSAVHRNLTARTYGEIDALEEKLSFLSTKGFDRHAVAYMQAHTKTVLNRFYVALGSGLIDRSEIPFVTERLSQKLAQVAGALPSRMFLHLESTLPNRNLVMPGFRFPGEGEVRVSIILPVYNPGPGIRKCIESLRSQLLDGLEFIFVDDCSTDDSMKLVEEWAARDSRVNILRNDVNLGAGPSRNRGIEAAHGDYLSFIDPDDYVVPNFYELLYIAAISDGGHDIAKGLRVEAWPSGKESRNKGERLNKRISDSSPGRPLFESFSGDHCTAIYRRSLFENSNIRYGASRKGEDTTFTLRVCCRSEDIVLEPRAEYVYCRMREGSATSQQSPQRFDYELDGLEEKIAFLVGERFDDQALCYLASKIRFYLTGLYMATIENPSAPHSVSVYAERLKGIVGGTPACLPLQDMPAYKAIVKHRVILPEVAGLPVEQKAGGAMCWIDYIAKDSDLKPSCIDECAKAMADAVQKPVEAKDRYGFWDIYLRLVKRTGLLPAKPRAALLAKFHRRLASCQDVRSNVRSTFGRIKSKAFKAV